ncbi:MAG: Pyruvate/2-oxoacid:ferredoxin oxidoreductase delta subunit [Myxococcota bacterium]|jgi:Pyruvate/2-oxoacid:ferredoxin oxidoreductase delta subunit
MAISINNSLSGMRALVLREQTWCNTSLPQQLRELQVEACFSPCPAGAAAVLQHAERTGEPFDLLLVESCNGNRICLNTCAALCLQLSKPPAVILVTDTTHGFTFSSLTKSGVDAVLAPNASVLNLKRLLNSIIRLSA